MGSLMLASCLIAGVLFIQPAEAQEKRLTMTGLADSNLAPFDRLMSQFVRQHKVPGAALAVVKDGWLVYARGFGHADLEHHVAVAPRALFRIASISKPITAAAILKLVEEGKLRLDDRVVQILRIEPFLERGEKTDPRLRKVTIRHLLTHTAGWDRDKSFDPMFQSVKIARALKVPPPARSMHIIRYMWGRPLDFDPGTRYAYSNFGYCVLGRVIEKVIGESYENYVRRHILLPLGIRDMHIGKSLLKDHMPNEVHYYDGNHTGPAVFADLLGKRVPSPYGMWCIEVMDAHGGWVASAPDLVRFAAALDRPDRARLLRPAAIQVMFARPAGLPGFTEEGRPRDVYYGCGWQVRVVGNRGLNTWHIGSLDGTSTLLVRRFDGLDWAVLFNTRRDPQGRELAGLIDPIVHQAADQVQYWPRRNLFQ
jgi:CubicO group peptidase (beta-lactamase class C family)